MKKKIQTILENVFFMNTRLFERLESHIVSTQGKRLTVICFDGIIGNGRFAIFQQNSDLVIMDCKEHRIHYIIEPNEYLKLAEMVRFLTILTRE